MPAISTLIWRYTEDNALATRWKLFYISDVRVSMKLDRRYNIFCDGEFILFVNIVALGISNEFMGFADQSRSLQINRVSTHLRVDFAPNLNYIWFRHLFSRILHRYFTSTTLSFACTWNTLIYWVMHDLLYSVFQFILKWMSVIDH